MVLRAKTPLDTHEMWYTMFIVDTIEEQIITVLKKYGIKKAALFGSYVRGYYRDNSDIDILYL